jgi:hypothetical protein
MLTGKKIRALFFGILLMSLAVVLFPQKSFAQMSTVYIPGQTTTVPDFYKDVQNTYKAKPAEHTINTLGGNGYAITDGKTYLFYKKGVPDSAAAGPTGRDSSKDTLYAVMTSDGKVTELSTPILKTDEAGMKAAVNAAAAKAGDTTGTAWNSAISMDNSYAVMKKTQDELRAYQEEQKALQAKADAAEIAGETLSAEDEARLAYVNDQVYNLTDLNKKQDVMAAMQSRAPSPTPAPPDQIYCFNFSLTDAFWLSKPPVYLAGCAAMLTNFTMKIAAFFLWTAALLFDYTLGITLNIKPLVEKLTIVNIGWAIFRDISNLFFIFLLLFAAIGTIINNSTFNAKKMIPSILIAALLINFSLFFTKVVIDASNIIALQFYANMGGTTSAAANPFASTVTTNSSQATGIAAIFLKNLKFDNLYTVSTVDASTNQTAAVTTAGGGQTVGFSAYNMALVGLGGTILFLVTAFVLFAATFLFMIRTIILLVLMTTSPIAFISKAVPGGLIKGLGDDWWKNLWKSAFFAPVYMSLMYISVIAVKSLGSTTGAGSWSDMFNGKSSSINIIFTFVMIIGFMLLALISAQKMGAAGASTALGAGKKLRGMGLSALRASTLGVAGVGARSVIGGTANWAANTEWAKKRIANGGIGARAFKNIAGSVADAKFGLSRGYAQTVKDKTKEEEAMHEFVGEQDKLIKGKNEGDTAFKERQKAEKKKAEERQERFVDNNVSRLSTPTRYAAAQAFQSKAIKAKADKAAAKAKIEGAKEDHVESVKGLVTSSLDIKDVEASVALDRIKAERKRVEEALNSKDGGKALNGTIGQLATDIEDLEKTLSGLGLKDAGKRDVLNGQIAKKNRDMTIAVAKFNTSIDKLMDIHQREESGLEKEVRNLTKTMKNK